MEDSVTYQGLSGMQVSNLSHFTKVTTVIKKSGMTITLMTMKEADHLHDEPKLCRIIKKSMKMLKMSDTETISTQWEIDKVSFILFI
jgi:hypothetical protein